MKNFLYIFLASFLLNSCSNNLSRSEAERLISNNSKFQEIGIHPKLKNNAKNDGINQGFWNKYRKLSPKGLQHFKSVSYTNLSLRTPLKSKVISIDGIAESKNYFGNGNDNFKEVQFSWEFFNANNVVKRFVLKGGKGVAYFRKFDDGWRIDNVSINYNNQPFALSQSDKQAIKEDIELENERRLAEQRKIEKQRAIRKAKEEKRKKLIKESKNINQTIGSYNGVNDFNGRNLKKKITLTDVNIYRDLSGSQYLNIWFGSVNSKPTAHRFRQTAMGWDGFVIKVADKQVVFKDEKEALRFYNDLILALEKWNKKYPELKKW